MKGIMLVGILLLVIAILGHPASPVGKVIGLFPSCPDSCDDDNKCTKDFCSEYTDFTCVSEPIVPCDGNGVCEVGEYLKSSDCPNCYDNDGCTKDSYNFEQQKCENELIMPCNGNKICEEGEYGKSSDCPDCGDNDKCTGDSVNYDTGQCIHEAITPCCGNGVKETGETCASCKEDVKCSSGCLCCSGSCVDVCTKDSDCVADDSSKIGKCSNPNTCYAKCSFELPSVVELKEGTYTAHGLKFVVVLDEYGSVVSYLDRSGYEDYLAAQNGMKLLKYHIVVQCVEDECSSFYVTSFSLMDSEGNIYEAKCPINWLGQCNNQDTIDSMYDGIVGEKRSGILIFSMPDNVRDVSLIYKFSSYKDNPKTLKFPVGLN